MEKLFNEQILVCISLFLAIVSIWFAYYLSTPINLEIWHKIKGEKLIIYGKNHDLLRSTGPIELYRMNIDPNIPLMRLKGDDILGPREKNKLFSLEINRKQSKPFIKDKLLNKTTRIPAGKIYYVMEKTSISYKITCDNCKNQGIIKRIPPLSEITISTILNKKKGIKEFSIPIYSWPEYNLDEMYKNNK
ncbi:MAG: hypothetical protein ACOCRO_05815 [Halanaerobiales bacterium]